jgi:hypothetical protein
VPRLQLQLFYQPAVARIIMNIKRYDGYDYLLEAEVDTGAQVSLLPIRLMEILEYQLITDTQITIDQAGIGKQAFSATEAYVMLSLEDLQGNQTEQFKARVWFADTDVVLLGFADILDRAILHIDMPQRLGWIEIDV